MFVGRCPLVRRLRRRRWWWWRRTGGWWLLYGGLRQLRRWPGGDRGGRGLRRLRRQRWRAQWRSDRHRRRAERRRGWYLRRWHGRRQLHRVPQGLCGSGLGSQQLRQLRLRLLGFHDGGKGGVQRRPVRRNVHCCERDHLRQLLRGHLERPQQLRPVRQRLPAPFRRRQCGLRRWQVSVQLPRGVDPVRFQVRVREHGQRQLRQLRKQLRFSHASDRRQSVQLPGGEVRNELPVRQDPVRKRVRRLDLGLRELRGLREEVLRQPLVQQLDVQLVRMCLRRRATESAAARPRAAIRSGGRTSTASR